MLDEQGMEKGFLYGELPFSSPLGWATPCLRNPLIRRRFPGLCWRAFFDLRLSLKGTRGYSPFVERPTAGHAGSNDPGDTSSAVRRSAQEPAEAVPQNQRESVGILSLQGRVKTIAYLSPKPLNGGACAHHQVMG